MLHGIISKISLLAMLVSIASCSGPETSTSKVVMEPEVEDVRAPEVEVVRAPEAEVVRAPETETVRADEPETTEVEPVPAPEVKTEDANDDASEVVISFGSHKLTMREIKLIHPQAEDSQIVRLANSWLDTHLFYAEAERRGLSSDPKLQFIADMMYKGEFIRGLRTQVENSVEVSDEDVQAYYDKNKDNDPRLSRMGYLNFSHVRTKTLEEATDVLKKIKSGEDISALARLLSIDKDAQKGGAVRRATYQRVELQFGKEFLDALSAAKEGDLVGPVKNKEDTYEVARLTGKTEPTPIPFEEVKERIKGQLRQEGVRKALIDLRDSLKKEAEGRVVKSPRLITIEQAMTEKKPEAGARVGRHRLRAAHEGAVRHRLPEVCLDRGVRSPPPANRR